MDVRLVVALLIHSGQLEKLKGEINVNCIPHISVYKKDRLWFTAGNRRLWVLQEAEKRGKCSEIYVRETSYINLNKFTTVNNGKSVFVRGYPGGYLWQSIPITKIKPKEPYKTTFLPQPKPPISTNDFNNQRHTADIVTEMRTNHSERMVPTKLMSKREGVQNGIAQPTASDIKVDTAKENKVVEKKKIRDDESDIMNHDMNISGFQNYNTFSRSNSDTSRQLGKSDVAVTITDENECTISVHCLAMYGFFLIVVLIVSLALIISNTAT